VLADVDPGQRVVRRDGDIQFVERRRDRLELKGALSIT
jgi:hypothetical protein